MNIRDKALEAISKIRQQCEPGASLDQRLATELAYWMKKAMEAESPVDQPGHKIPITLEAVRAELASYTIQFDNEEDENKLAREIEDWIEFAMETGIRMGKHEARSIHGIDSWLMAVDPAVQDKPGAGLGLQIGPDGRCQCSQGDPIPCPLGRTGSALRCTQAELEAAGVHCDPPVVVPDEAKPDQIPWYDHTATEGADDLPYTTGLSGDPGGPEPDPDAVRWELGPKQPSDYTTALAIATIERLTENAIEQISVLSRKGGA